MITRRNLIAVIAGGGLAVGAKVTTGSALPAPAKETGFSLEMEGPEYDALVASMPKGTVIEPYHIDCGRGPQTLFLKPVADLYAYVDTVMGWITATTPWGLTYYVGFELSACRVRYEGQREAERAGRESACKTLREAPKYTVLLFKRLREGSLMPKDGEIKVRY